MNLRRLMVMAVASAMILGVGGCATAPTDPTERAEFERTNDPLEPTNRVMFEVNDFLYRIVFRPLTRVYQTVLPEFVRDRIANVISNMEEPVVFLNNMLQARFSDAASTTGRFMTNTVLGGAGAFDLATDWGMPKQDGDFGQTLHSWGFEGGPYLVMPLFGPSNFRDGIGRIADMFASPWGHLTKMGSRATENRFMAANAVGSGLVRFDRNMDALDNLREGSLDYYAQMRSVYRQYRNKQLGITETAPTDFYGDNVGDYAPLTDNVKPAGR